MSSNRLYAIVLRLAALRPGAIPADHGDQARAALLNLIQRADSPLAKRLHDENTQKPYTISLLNGGKRGHDGAQHFGEGESADWRFTLLTEPAFEALLRRYLLSRDLPHVRIGAVQFAIVDVFASGTSHPDSGHISIEELTDRWNIAPETLPKHLTLDFLSPTAFNFGQDKQTGEYRIHSQPDPQTVFSALRNKWKKLSGVEPGIAFDEWVGRAVEAEPLQLRTRRVWIEKRPVAGFIGQVRYRVHGTDIRWLSFLHLLSQMAFWTGVGYQTPRGMGQVRIKSTH